MPDTTSERTRQRTLPPRARAGRLSVRPHLTIVAAVLACAVTFLATIVAIPAAAAVVGIGAWAFLLAACLALTAATNAVARFRLSAVTWAKVLLYSALLAAIFAGADSALRILGNSVKPRASLPESFAGLELYHAFVPGLASVAVAGLVGALVHARQHRSN